MLVVNSYIFGVHIVYKPDLKLLTMYRQCVVLVLFCSVILTSFNARSMLNLSHGCNSEIWSLLIGRN